MIDEPRVRSLSYTKGQKMRAGYVYVCVFN